MSGLDKQGMEKEYLRSQIKVYQECVEDEIHPASLSTVVMRHCQKIALLALLSGLFFNVLYFIFFSAGYEE